MRIACIVASVPGHRHPGLVDPAGELLDELDRPDLVLARQREADALAHPLVDVVVDPLVAVAEDHRAVAHPEVDVLVAVEVPDRAALAPIDVDGVVAPRPEVRVRAARQRLAARAGTGAAGASRRGPGLVPAAGSVVMITPRWTPPCSAAGCAEDVAGRRDARRNGCAIRDALAASWHTAPRASTRYPSLSVPMSCDIRRASGRSRRGSDGIAPAPTVRPRAVARIARSMRSASGSTAGAGGPASPPLARRRCGRRRDRRGRVHRPVDGDRADRHGPVAAGRRRSRRSPSGSGRAAGTAASARRR